MLTSISIHNYALINQLSIDFSNGLSIITGETGAGKSILLGALGLVLGNRADLSSLKDTSKKCIVEAKVAIANYDLKDFFEKVDLDYEDTTILRREILPSGKSRAFVNDTPVTLSVLNQLRSKLIDVHSQHQTMQLSDASFQFMVLDGLSKNAKKVASYKRGVQQLHQHKKELEELNKDNEKLKEPMELPDVEDEKSDIDKELNNALLVLTSNLKSDLVFEKLIQDLVIGRIFSKAIKSVLYDIDNIKGSFG